LCTSKASKPDTTPAAATQRAASLLKHACRSASQPAEEEERIRQRMRQHTSAYVSTSLLKHACRSASQPAEKKKRMRQRMRQHTSAHVSAYETIRNHTSSKRITSEWQPTKKKLQKKKTCLVNCRASLTSPLPCNAHTLSNRPRKTPPQSSAKDACRPPPPPPAALA
jgi:tellurite resistance protein